MISNDPERNTPQYKAFRWAVMKRDEYKCQRCSSNKGLEVHHIKRFADNVRLRTVTSNGILLCGLCHEMVTGHEEKYEDEFKKIVASKKMNQTINRYGGESRYRPKWSPKNPELGHF